MYKSTHKCGDVRPKDLGEEVFLNGWVNTIRLHGQIIFVDLRDRFGLIQLVFDSTEMNLDFESIKKLSMEDVLSVKGIVRMRGDYAKNDKLKTGEIEILIKNFEILNKSKPLPFILSDRGSSDENLRLKYRYLELRMDELQKNILLRHKTYQETRNFLSNNDFIEVETPILMKSTPEGARDYLVPSRIQKGKFYALPQSPQLYKQILMIAGYDRYFQIVKCFRDEDLRADRQPEFTQIDIEMSFIDENDIFLKVEKMVKHIFKNVSNIDLKETFPKLTYTEAIEKYGSDKPDLRYDLQINNFKTFMDLSDFEAFENNDYPPHEKLYLLRENNDGKIVFLTDFTIEGEGHFGGEFDNNTYSFNITRYFVQLLTNDQYTNKLYLVPVLGSANANRTILNKSKISINIIYTEI